jgi:hypothetical protein
MNKKHTRLEMRLHLEPPSSSLVATCYGGGDGRRHRLDVVVGCHDGRHPFGVGRCHSVWCWWWRPSSFWCCHRVLRWCVTVVVAVVIVVLVFVVVVWCGGDGSKSRGK